MGPATDRDNNASAQPVARALDVDLLDHLMAKRGVTSVKAMADLMGVHRSTMFEWRAGSLEMSFKNALKLADLAGTTVIKLFPRRSHPPSGPTHPPSGPANPPRENSVV
jgi:DNA-binding XRE family transcriptional regulator